MKKATKWIVAVCLMLCVAFTATGCSLFGGGSNSGQKDKEPNPETEKPYAFKVQYEDELKEYEFTGWKNISVSIPHKDGYVTEGLFTEENGAGKKMINYTGKCWNSEGYADDGSTVLYPYYTELDRDFEYKSGIYFDEDAKSANYNVYGPTVGYTKVENLKNTDELMKIAYSYPDMTLRLTAKAMFAGSKGSFYVGIGTTASEDNLGKATDFAKLESGYVEHAASTEIRARALTVNNAMLLIGVKCTGGLGTSFSYKNLQYVITIA